MDPQYKQEYVGGGLRLRLQVFQGFCAFYPASLQLQQRVMTGEKIGRRRPRNVRVNDVGADKRREMMRGRDERSRRGRDQRDQQDRELGHLNWGHRLINGGRSPGGLASDAANSTRHI